MLNYCLVRFLYFLIMFIIIIIIITPILTYKVDRTINHSQKLYERENDLKKLLSKIPYQKSTMDNIFRKQIDNNIKDVRRDSVDMAKIDDQEQQLIATDYTKNVIEEIKAYIIKIMKELNEIEKKISVSNDHDLEKNTTKSLDQDQVKTNKKSNVKPKNVLKIKIHEHDVDNNNNKVNNSTGDHHHKHQNGHDCDSSNDLEYTTLDKHSDKNYDDVDYDDDDDEDNDNADGDGTTIKTTETDYIDQIIKDNTRKCKCCHQKLPPSPTIHKPKTHNEKENHKLNHKDKDHKDGKEDHKEKEHQDKENKIIIEDKKIENVQQSNEYNNDDLTLSYSNLQENLTNDDYLWSDWSNWSVCSTTCGPGKQLRYRRCTHTERQCRVKYEVDEKNCLIKSC